MMTSTYFVVLPGEDERVGGCHAWEADDDAHKEHCVPAVITQNMRKPRPSRRNSNLFTNNASF